MNRINELIEKRNAVLSQNLKKDGHLSSRERINLLFDEGSFIETDMFSGRGNSEGVITGYGTVDGRAVFTYAQDGSAEGAFSKEQAKKIIKIMRMAQDVAAPLVALTDSYGVKLSDGTDALSALGMMYYELAALSDDVLTICAVFGRAAGGMAISAALSDFVVMTKDAHLMLNGDEICRKPGRDLPDHSSAKVNSSLNGNTDFVADNDEGAIAKIRELITLLPGASRERSPETKVTDDLNRASEAMLNETITSEEIIKEIADNNYIFSIAEDYSEAAKAYFIKINGRTVTALGTEGELDIRAMDKLTKLIHLSDKLNIPVLTICKTTGFKASEIEEKGALLKNAANLSKAYSKAKVPKVTLVADAFTSAGVITGSRVVGADFVLALPTASIGALTPSMASLIMPDDKDEYLAEKSSAFGAASTGYIDDVIEPETVRPRVAAAFEMLFGKLCRKDERFGLSL